MAVERAQVVGVIVSIGQAILADRRSRMIPEAEQRAREIVRRACDAHGLTVETWNDALNADADLLRLFDQALLELIVDPPDPGPYDEISRESPRGAPETDQQAFAREARLLGRPLR